MEINVIVSDLVKKLSNMFAITSGTEREILTAVLLDASTVMPTLAATDGRLIQGHVKLGSKVVANGRCLITPEILAFVKAFKDKSKPANLRLDGTTLTVKIEKATADFSVPDVGQYPVLLNYADPTHTVNSKDFLLALKSLNMFSGKDPYNMWFLRSDSGKLLMGTTDNFRLAFFNVACDLGIPLRAVPTDIIGALSALGEEKTIRLAFDGNALVLACSDYIFQIVTVDGQTKTNVLQFYGDPQGSTFDVAELTEKVKAANAIGDHINLDLQGHISTTTTTANYEDTFKCTPTQGTFLVNGKHLADALKLPFTNPMLGVYNLGARQLLHVRDAEIQQYLIPLETA